jgi:uncharacterized protein (DUF2237 family)
MRALEMSRGNGLVLSRPSAIYKPPHRYSFCNVRYSAEADASIGIYLISASPDKRSIVT